MSRVCELTGKRGLSGNTVSNANNKSRTKSYVNLSWKRFYVPELKSFVRARVSNRAIRSIDKIGGLVQACKKNEKTISDNLRRLVSRAKRVEQKRAQKVAA